MERERPAKEGGRPSQRQDLANLLYEYMSQKITNILLRGLGSVAAKCFSSALVQQMLQFCVILCKCDAIRADAMRGVRYTEVQVMADAMSLVQCHAIRADAMSGVRYTEDQLVANAMSLIQCHALPV